MKRLFQRLAAASRKRNSQHRPRRNTRRKLALEQLDSRRLLAVAFGDFNNDGYDDMAVGVVGEDVGSIANAGAVNVIYGSASGLAASGDEIWTQESDGVQGVAESGDQFGAALAVGDFNNDGYDDLAIGTPGENVGDIADAGAVNVLYGSASGLTATGDDLFYQDSSGILEVADAYDHFGAVLSTGDYDGDGYDDLAIGVPNENLGSQQDAGIVHILYGGGSGLTTTGDQLFSQDTNGIDGTAERYDHFGASLASADFNHDGRDDLAIGTPGEDTSSLYDTGGIHVLYGTASGLGAANSQFYTQDSSGVPSSPEEWDNFGMALAAGDFDGDSYADLAIGSPNEDHAGSLVDAGVIHVMYGRNAFGFDPTRHQMWHQDVEYMEGAAEAYDYYGASLFAADFNNDGRDDLAIGVPGENVGNISNAGAVNLMFGSGVGLRVNYDRIYHQDTTDAADTAEASDWFGSVVAAGDTNGDGYADLAVALPNEDVGSAANAGAVHVFRGQNAYDLRMDNDVLWTQDSPWIEGVAEAGDSFGGEQPLCMNTGTPEFQSNPNATKHLYLDLNGGTSNGISTESFRLDDMSNFNWTERSMIEDIWAYVAEDYAPFNINVTTVYPTGADAGSVFRVLIGGDGSERQENPTSGWGPGDFTDASDDNNDVYVYSKRIESWYNVGDNLAARIGTTASHESGHGFGLGHKKTYDSEGNKLDEYSDGGSDWTPIMGGNLATDRTIWTQSWVYLTPDTYAEGSEDFDVLQGELGLRSEDHWSSLGSATNLGSIGSTGMLTDTGLIKSDGDLDTFKFQVVGGGSYNLRVSGAEVGANLDATLQLKNSNGTVLATASPSDDIGATIFAELSAGTYYLTVGSQGTYTGDVGQYTLRVIPSFVVLDWANYAPGMGGDSGNTNGSRGGGESGAPTAAPQLAALLLDLPAKPFAGPTTPKPADEPAGTFSSHGQAIDAVMAHWPTKQPGKGSSAPSSKHSPQHSRDDGESLGELAVLDAFWASFGA